MLKRLALKFAADAMLPRVAFVFACVVFACFVSGEDDIVTFQQGRVLGSKIPGYVRQFLGVPFSASTDGANKWLPPQPRAPWDYVLDCSNWGAGCTQPHHNRK